MATVQSVFGAYADKLQVIIDKSKDKFAPVWFKKYFDWAMPTTSLTFVSAIGRSRIEAAASITARGSKAPLRTRAGLDKLSGKVPAITEKFNLNEEDYRNWLTLQNMAVSDETKRTAMLDLMFGDVKRAGDASNKRVDMMVLEGISTGQITATVTNNPDGVVAPTPIDLFMPAENKVNAAVNWATSATATPLTDIQVISEAAAGKGVIHGKILLSRAAFLNFVRAKEVKDSIGTFIGVRNVSSVMPTLANINDFMTAQGWPMIEIVDEVIGVEKDGIITPVRPFSQVNAVFVPDGKLGVIHNAIPIEKIQPATHVTYADFDRSLISKWQETDPFNEYTKVELNAFPGIETIDSIYLLSTNVAFA